MNSSVSYAMEQFFGGNFHPDWDLEAEDWPQIVDSFVVGEKPEQLRSLARDIDEFRKSRPDVDLHAAMMKLGGFYDPRPEMTYSEWLGHVAERLRQHATAIDTGQEFRPGRR
ncbi:contact-dependent growth inhibition system immunity protein [Mycolicibacterium sp.]|uniref:contact-dependent growth inhibition system immunity protein n=1 Tax=Mycolicibacterium sp. TaxID=2320850 RepID=UPI0037C7425A